MRPTQMRSLRSHPSRTRSRMLGMQHYYDTDLMKETSCDMCYCHCCCLTTGVGIYILDGMSNDASAMSAISSAGSKSVCLFR